MSYKPLEVQTNYDLGHGRFAINKLKQKAQKLSFLGFYKN